MVFVSGGLDPKVDWGNRHCGFSRKKNEVTIMASPLLFDLKKGKKRERKEDENLGASGLSSGFLPAGAGMQGLVWLTNEKNGDEWGRAM